MANSIDAAAAKQTHSYSLMQVDGIIGVGVGYLDPEDVEKGAAVLIYINEKHASAVASTIPEFLADDTGVEVPTRIEVTGEFFPQSLEEPVTLSNEFQQRIRPVRAGYQVERDGSLGTLGLIVRIGGQLRMASNTHVLVRGNTPSNTIITQGGDRVGLPHQYVPLESDADNIMDAASASFDSQNLVEARYGNARTVVPGYVDRVRVGWRVWKAGRTTGVTSGSVRSIGTDVSVNYATYGMGNLKFIDQVIIGGGVVSKRGDSGSVWLRNSDNQAAAMNFAGPDDGSFSISFPFVRFARMFRVQSTANFELHSIADVAANDEGFYSRDEIPSSVNVVDHKTCT